MQPSHTNIESTRPVGRFLLGLEDLESKHDTYTYALRFATDYQDILDHNRQASRVAVEEIDGQRVELEFVADQPNGGYVWRIAVGAEQYELHADNYETYGTYYEFTSQRAVLRRRHITSMTDLSVLESVVEYMTDTLDFHRNASALRGDKTRAHASIAELSGKEKRTHGDDRNLSALRSHLFVAGFPVGSRDISGLMPLLGSDN